jgi:hypothetical protein
MRRGFGKAVDSLRISEYHNGLSRIQIQQLEPVEVHLNRPCAGYLISNGNLEALPIGSTLDLQKGIYYWQPGLAFFKDFLFVFIEEGPDGALSKRKVKITVGSKE